MNKERRKELEKARSLLDEAQAIIEQARDEETEYYENMPESLQSGDKGQAAEAASEYLSSAAEQVGEALENLDNAISG